MEQEALLLQFDKLIKALTALTKTMGDAERKRLTAPQGKKKAEIDEGREPDEANGGKAREVVKKDTPVLLDEYGDKAKKFWRDLFKEHFKKTEDVSKKPEKKGGFLEMLLTLLGGAILGAYTIFKEKILPILEQLFGRVKGLFKILEDAWKVIKEGKIGELFGKIGRAIKGFFRQVKLSVIKQLRKSKVGRFILRTIQKVQRAFTNIAKGIARVISKLKTGTAGRVIGKIMSGVSRLFGAFAKGVKAGLKVGGKIIKSVVRVVKMITTAFGKIGKIIAKLLPGIKVIGRVVGKLFLPLTILMGAFDIFSGIFAEVQQEGLSFTSILKGFAAGLVKIFTLGFLDTDTIIKGMNTAIDKLGDFFANLWEKITNLPTIATNMLRKIPGAKWILGEEKELPSELAAKAGKATTEADVEAYKKKIGYTSKKKVTATQPASSAAAPPTGGEDLIDPDTGENLGKAPAPAPLKIAQDFVSRPGQDPVYFTEKDTVIGAKSGGPIEKLLQKSVDASDKIGDAISDSNDKLISLLTDNNALLAQLIDAMQQTNKGGAVVVNNARQNTFVLGAPSSPSKFRSSIAT